MAKRPKYPPNWHEHPWPQLVVLGIDQSMANTGWALVSFADGERPTLERHGTIVTKPSAVLTSYDDSLARGVEIYQQLRSIVRESMEFSWRGDLVVVHETPAIDTATKHRPAKIEGGPIAALAVRLAALDESVPSVVMMPANTTKKIVTGDGRADKPVVKESVLFAVQKAPPPYRLNEHVSDAIALALAAVVDGRAGGVVDHGEAG